MSKPDNSNQFLLYTAPDGAVKVEVFYQDETVWLTQKALAELFGVQRPAVTKHLGNIFTTGELEEDSVCSILEHTAADGKTYSAKYYNLDAIIAVGYRVNSYQATQFRIWATKTLREFLIKGFVLDDERLKQGASSRALFSAPEKVKGLAGDSASSRSMGRSLTRLTLPRNELVGQSS